MNRSWQRWLTGAFALLSAAAVISGCSEPSVKPPGGDTKKPAQLVLTRVGPGAFQSHPGDPFTLRVLLSETTGEDGKVIPGASVKWKPVQRPGAINIETDTAVTNEAGVAEIRITCVDVGEFQFRADSEGATTKAFWKIDCANPLRFLRIVEQPPGTFVTDAPQNTKASGQVVVNKTIPLQVKALEMVGDKETPLANQEIAFQVTRGLSKTELRSSDSTQTDPAYQKIRSSALGLATVTLFGGATTGPVTVLATWGNLPPVEFSLNVVLVPSCESSAQCARNQVCVDNLCQERDDTINLTCGSSDRGCPLGYTCVEDNGAKVCKPYTGGDCGTCPGGFICDVNTNTCTKENPDCTTDAECPNGQCRWGVCYPNNPGDVIDASGHWYTKHDFNVKDALPGWVQFGGTAIRTIDQILLGQLNLPSWVNAIIRGIVNQYVPQWVQTLVYLLDNMLTLFSNLRAEGEMDMSKVGGPALLAGSEYWSSFIFYLLSQCGQNIGGDPSMPPPCARVDIYTTELDAADLAVDVKPFTAKVIGPQGGPFQIIFDQREAKMKLAGIIKYVLDQAVAITTGYPSLEGPPGRPEEGALYNLVDCPGIAAQVMGLGLPVDITGICQVAVIAIAQSLADQLRNQVVSTDVLQFYGQATAWDQSGGITVASDLGYADFETRSNPDGKWTGKVNMVGSVKNVPGRWRASREPILQ
jgi:hypothetical protein